MDGQLLDGRGYQVWRSHDEYGTPLAVKIWPYAGEGPDDLSRALWDVELRHLFRLSSLPSADASLAVLRDAGLDRLLHLFVMVISVPGLTLLSEVLRHRGRHAWLRDLTQPKSRWHVWRGIRRLTRGLQQLHEQQMLHRAVAPDCVFVNPDDGPGTMRLGGFEWTVRVGSAEAIKPTPASHSSHASVHSFESDWLSLGMLIARIFVPLAEDAGTSAAVAKLRQSRLSEIEQHLVEQLLTQDDDARLASGFEILERMDEILRQLDEPMHRPDGSYLALLVQLGPQRPLTLEVTTHAEEITALETEQQRIWIEDDVCGATIVRYGSSTPATYALIGKTLGYRLSEFVPEGTPRTGAWDIAYCSSAFELRHSSADDQIRIKDFPIKVFLQRAMYTDETVVRKNAVPWTVFLPGAGSEQDDQQRLEAFHDFFRVTNQLELLMRDAEVFAYETEVLRNVDANVEEVVLHETQRARPPLSFAGVVPTLVDYLARQLDDSSDEGLVYLGAEEALYAGRTIGRDEAWRVTSRDASNNTIVLRRLRVATNPAPPSRGFLRTFGMFGQMSLLVRRRRAIGRLKEHAYLLQALQRPDYVYLDAELELPIDIDPGKIDDAKRGAMRDIWRTRPIFALQGPPGTGKTTLVAHLLHQIFADDRVAQVLVTAQAHAAVDVLREKVAEGFDYTSGGLIPLSVRLRRSKDDDKPDPDYVEQVAARMLNHAIRKLEGDETRSAIAERWLNLAKRTIRALGDGGENDEVARDLCELVRRSANVTYCTTTAGNLAELAESTQTFDWSIIEESGKAHGFDLVLPLQTGHRWLLIGDQDQLPPYRIEDFRDALSRLDESFQALQDLPDRGGNQVDVELALRWRRLEPDERESRRQLWLQWLPFFRQLHERCLRVKEPASARSDGANAGAIASMLSQQHRMHPTIADLVSSAYYKNGIQSMTLDTEGEPLERVRHQLTAPAGIAGRAIVWLDIPSASNGGPEESGGHGGGRYTSTSEALAISRFLEATTISGSQQHTLALLSPYRLQVEEIRRTLRTRPLPPWVSKPTDYVRAGAARALGIHTVDSFQGDQADVVIVSLVRNNRMAPGSGIGFLREAQRMNVLFSRAERLLVLVGSWDFLVYQLTGVPADAGQPLGHWRIALDYLSGCFDAGTAVKIPVGALPGFAGSSEFP